MAIRSYKSSFCSLLVGLFHEISTTNSNRVMYSAYPFIVFVFQEGFTQHNVVDTILALLSLINGIQLDGLKERMLLSGAGQLQIDGLHDWQSDHGFSITHTFASPCENVSTIAEEG